MQQRLCAGVLLLLVGVTQARFIVLTNQEDDAWHQSAASAFTDEPPAVEAGYGGPLSLRSLNPLSWFSLPAFAGQGSLGKPTTEPDLMEDMLRHVRCSRLRAALRDWQTAKRVDELGMGSGTEYNAGLPQADLHQQELAEHDQHASFLGQLISHTQHAASQLADGVVKQAYLEQQQLQQQRHHDDMIMLHDATVSPDSIIDAEEAQWVESANGNTEPAAYEDEQEEAYTLGTGTSLDTQTLWARAREAGERYRREELDAATAKSTETVFGDSQPKAQLVVDEEAAELQRDLDEMLGASQQQQQQQDTGILLIHDANTARMSDIIEVGSSLATHLLRGMATAAQQAQDAADQAQAAMEEEAMVLESHAQAAEAVADQHSGGASEVLVLYPYDQESDDVFAFRGALQPGGAVVESGSGTLLFLHPLAFAAHMVRDLRQRFNMLWSLQLEDAMAQFMMPMRLMESDDLQYAYEGYPYEYEGEEALNVGGEDNSGSDLFFPLTASSADPLFLSSWWGAAAPASAASGSAAEGAREAMGTGGPFPWAEAGRQREAAEEEGDWHTGVALLCVLLLAVAFMVTAFVRSLGSLRRVMRRQELLVPFLMEANDGTYTQGYMLVDEAQLLAAAVASAEQDPGSKDPEAVGGAKALASGGKEEKATAQAAWAAIEQQQQQQAATTQVEKEKEELV